jgi:hypothetical protein
MLYNVKECFLANHDTCIGVNKPAEDNIQNHRSVRWVYVYRRGKINTKTLILYPHWQQHDEKDRYDWFANWIETLQVNELF